MQLGRLTSGTLHENGCPYYVVLGFRVNPTRLSLGSPGFAESGARPVGAPVQFNFFAVPPRSLHHRLRERLRAPRSTQVLSTRSLGLLNFASEVGLSQHTV